MAVGLCNILNTVEIIVISPWSRVQPSGYARFCKRGE